MATPDWNGQDKTAVSFGKSARLVTPSDTTMLDPYAKAVCVSDITSGANLSILTLDGVTIPYVNIMAGFTPPYQVKRVNSTGTTCVVYTVD